MSSAAHHLQCARWDRSAMIDQIHEFSECGEDSACELLHDIQRNISNALDALGEPLCRTPFSFSTDYRPEGWIEPLHPDDWYTGMPR